MYLPKIRNSRKTPYVSKLNSQEDKSQIDYVVLFFYEDKNLRPVFTRWMFTFKQIRHNYLYEYDGDSAPNA